MQNGATCSCSVRGVRAGSHTFGLVTEKLAPGINSIPSGQSAWLLTAFGLDGAGAADGEALAAEGTIDALLATRGDALAVLASGAGVA
jgi:hypothetical protein